MVSVVDSSRSKVVASTNLNSNTLKAAVRSRYLGANPAIGTSLPRQARREQLFITPEEVDRLAVTVGARYRTLVYVLAYGGLRWGEAAALRRRRVDVLRGRIEVAESLAEVGGDFHFGATKNYRNRTIVMPGFLREMLNEQLVTLAAPGPEGLVFTAANGSPMRNSNFSSNEWKPAIAATGLPAALRIHDLRHTAVALLIRQGAHPEAIKRHLGHSSIMVTMDVYGHLFPSDAEALADKLDAVYRQSQTDKIRTKLQSIEFRENQERPKTESRRGFSPVGPVGLEPTTNGLKARCSAKLS